MDELIVLLIKGIIRMLRGPPQGRQQQRPPGAVAPPVSPPPFQQRPGSVATARRAVVAETPRPAAPPRRQGRRPLPATVAMAAPILTPTGADRDLPSPAAAVIRASRGSVADKADAKAAASPTDVRRWLTPAALRRQVVLAEILGKPLAMRDER